jgi:EmrB/QacA subfamily drug resistance transporter
VKASVLVSLTATARSSVSHRGEASRRQIHDRIFIPRYAGTPAGDTRELEDRLGTRSGIVAPRAITGRTATMSAPPAPAPPPGVDYERRWFVLVAVGIGIFLSTVDGSIVNLALPTLEEEFDVTFGAVQWVVLAYLLTLATLVLAIGRLGDMVGKKRIYTAGFSVFTVASLLCGLAPSLTWLVVFRIIQAVGASMLQALGLAITTEAFPASERGRALGINGAVVSLGIITGPTLGGLIIDSLSWNWIFFVNLPVGIVGTLAAIRFVPNVPARPGQRFDFVGAGTFFVTLLGVLVGMTMAQDRGFADPTVLALIAVGLVFLAAFVLIERSVDEPMLDLSLFRNRLLSVNLFTGWTVFVGISGLLILLPFYLENVLGYPPRTVGLIVAAVPVSLIFVSPASGVISDRIGPRPVTVAGLAVLVVAYLFVSLVGMDAPIALFVIALLPIGVGTGIFQSPNNSAVLGSVPHHRLGVTSGMLTITRITGQITGIAVLGTIWAMRVSAISGVGGDATAAPPAAQAQALQDTARTVAVVMAVSLAFAAWGWLKERRDRTTATEAGVLRG